jgi:hypothetical protein
MNRIKRLGPLLTLVLGCSRMPIAQDSAGTPPAYPTHHARVEGMVVGAGGQPLKAISVGARYAASSAPARRVNVTGGTHTDTSGAYGFDVESSAPKTPDGVADIYAHASKYGDPGQTVMEDSVLITVRLVPLDRPPLVTRAPPLRLPIR